MSKLVNLFTNPKKIFCLLGRNGFFHNIDDKKYMEIFYYCCFGKKLDFTSPKTFNEKLQWLKLYDRKPIYTEYVDKYEVKQYITDWIGEDHIVPTYGVWDSFDEIDFASLPNQFVLKCTHDSGGLAICRNKDKFDYASAKKKISRCLKNDFYWSSREWPYKNVKKRVIAEKYMSDGSFEGLTDYKFYCFNGEAKFLYVSQGLEHHETARISFCDFEGKLLPFYRKDYKPFESDITMPSNINEMRIIADDLAKRVECPFVRIDLYSVDSKIYFSEITFYPNGGYTPFKPEEWDEKLGEMIDLTGIISNRLIL